MEIQYDDEAIASLTAALAAELKAHGRRLATAESCTGGWISKVCTDLAGSSDWFERGFVSYSNASKHELLGVRPADIHRFGAVSEEVAAAMALGAQDRSGVDYALSVSGVAGPGGGSPEKPVGTVCFGWALPHEDTETETLLFVGDRDDIRRQTVVHSIRGLLSRIARR